MNTLSESVRRIADQCRAANARREPVGPLDLSAHTRVIAHVPEDMTVSVETGITLDALQQCLGRHRQWLPLDPAGADRLTVRELLDDNRSGPHRFGYGTARDWLLGMKAVMADGRVITSGAKVVKNVAGYDLHKLLIGAHGELAVLVEANFKISPQPPSELVLEAECSSTPEAVELLQETLKAAVHPVVLDLVRTQGSGLRLIVAFAGTERETAWQQEQIKTLAPWRPATLDYEREFHRILDGRSPKSRSALPERLAEALEQQPPPWIARAGNGVIYGLPTVETDSSSVVHPLNERIRALFDPHGIFRVAA